MKKFALAGAALAALMAAAALPSTASAEPDGWYVAADVGYHAPQEIGRAHV